MHKLLALLSVFVSPALAQTPAGVINAPIYATGYISQVGGTNVTTNIPPQPNHPTNLNIYTTGAISGTWTIKLPNPAFEGQILSFNCGSSATAIAVTSTDGSSLDSSIPTSCNGNSGFVVQFDQRNNIWRNLGSNTTVLVGVTINNNTQLTALPSSITAATRLGYAAAGDAPAVLYTRSNSACSLNAGAGDGGSQVPTSDGKCWVASLPQAADIRIWGASTTASGAVNTAAINAALLAAPTSGLVPAGEFHVTDMLSCQAGGALRGVNRQVSVLTVGAASNDFNMSATGVIRMGPTGSRPGCNVSDLKIKYYQPEPLTRANIIKYPPALDGKDIYQWQINNVLIENGWQCLDARGNVGGLHIGRLECGGAADSSATIGGAIALDGATDFVHIDSVEHWPYGFTASGISMFIDETTIAATIGRVDGGVVNKFSTYTGKLIVTANASIGTPFQISNLTLDGNGAVLVKSGGDYQVGAFYSTKSGADTNAYSIIDHSGGTLGVSHIVAASYGGLGPAIYTSGGIVQINGGRVNHGAYGQPFAQVSGGVLGFANTDFTYPTLAPRSVPYLYQTGGALRAIGNRSTTNGPSGSTSSMIAYTVDNAGNFAQGNDFYGWTPQLTFTTAVGFYDFNEPLSFTATPRFATNGTFSPTVTTNTAYYFWKGNYVDLSFDQSWDTNAYAGASGAFSFSLSGVPAAKDTWAACSLGSAAKFSLGASYYGASAVMQTTYLYPTFFYGGATYQFMGTTQVPASTTGMGVRIACRYRVR